MADEKHRLRMKTRVLSCLGLLTAVACTANPACAAAEKPARKPNSIFFLADDLGWRDAGCYGSKELTENTIVIFMSDNGGLSTAEGSPTSNFPLRGGKGWLYEGGIREPMIIDWPGVVKQGSVSDTPVISTDFYPTMLEMAGLPPMPRQHVDGVSMVPILKPSGRPASRPLFWHYPHYGNQGGSPSSAVLSDKWKLIEFFEGNRLELYNMRFDYREQHNLAAEQPKRAAELHEKLRAWRTSVGARMPTLNPKAKTGPEKQKSVAWIDADD